MVSEATTITVPGPDGDRQVRISSPSRVLWPDVGITKLQLAEYIVAVGDPFVRANGDRPVSLQRFPDGIDGEQFFSKNPPKGARDFVTVGDPWARFGAEPGTVDVLLDWWQRDLDSGLGELPFPPDYPKMPGEPPRVQPSRAKKD